jgi:hypothetical protein
MAPYRVCVRIENGGHIQCQEWLRATLVADPAVFLVCSGKRLRRRHPTVGFAARNVLRILNVLVYYYVSARNLTTYIDYPCILIKNRLFQGCR